eukprot:gnl/TRDRNA2_/TRDRNA2_157331_c0_seq2.p1 gnl/TRDRNA2_/TRDRNA2_157331_c0~~gnl/TRDRNA2_/TRDRNA2_157331_c0_seq2.p1  ORF type:complete len:666 (-),score=128.11 gnl/TRDRNA2_/TRDRNA2_157331_c0_seq2:529-2526(-)
MAPFRPKFRKPRSGEERGGGRRLTWIDDTTFKAEFEGDKISDDTIEDWEIWMEEQLEKKYGGDEIPDGVVAYSLNFSRNDIGDEGIRSIIMFFRDRNISVLILKLFHNQIGDDGAWAIGQLMSKSPEPMQEVHLSHNRITEQGARWIFEAIARCQRYPFSRDRQGSMPIWLRMEHNTIDWDALEPRLDQQGVRWCVAENRDAWKPKHDPPMLCMHDSFRNQKFENGRSAPSGRWESQENKDWDWGSDGGEWDDNNRWEKHKQKWTSEEAQAWTSEEWKSDRDNRWEKHRDWDSEQNNERSQNHERASTRREKSSSERSSDGEEDPEAVVFSADVPMYVFLDASAVRKMISDKEGLVSFQGLLNLCQNGHMKCCPTSNNPAPIPSWVGEVEERDRIIFLMTDYVLDELRDTADAGESKKIEWLRNARDSFLPVCHSWGILEVLDTDLHSQLMKLTSIHEKKARQMEVSPRTLKMIDFACLWEAQIDSKGRVLFVTSDVNVYRFASEVCTDLDKRTGGGSLVMLHADELEKQFAGDRKNGGHLLCEAARKERLSRYYGVTLCASVMASVAASTKAPSLSTASPANGDGRETKGPPSKVSQPTVSQANGGARERSEIDVLRREIREGVALFARVHRLWTAGGEDCEVINCWEQMNDASARWQKALGRK